MHSIGPSVYRTILLSGIAVTLAACGNAAGQFVESSGFGPKMTPAQDFVVQSRPKQDLDFIPVNPAAPIRAAAPKTADQVKSAEKEMDSIREKNVNAGAAAAKTGGTPPPDPVLMPAPKRGQYKPDTSPSSDTSQ